MKKVLLVEPGRIGDWIVSQSIVRDSAFFEGDRVDWVVRSEVMPLFHREDICGQIFELAQKNTYWRMFCLLSSIYTRGGAYDEICVLGYGRSADSVVKAVAARKKYGCIGMRDRSGIDRNGNAFSYDGREEHISLRAIKALGLDVPGQMTHAGVMNNSVWRARYDVCPEDLAESARVLEQSIPKDHLGSVAIHTGSSWKGKCWPAENWIQLCNRLVGNGKKVVAIVGPGDEERITEIRNGIQEPSQMSVLPMISLGVLAGVLKQLPVLVCNDSGVMHLAAAVGTNVVALFGATRPEICAPLVDSSQLVALHCSDLPCVPCVWPSVNPYGLECKFSVPRCMLGLTVDMVYDGCRQFV